MHTTIFSGSILGVDGLTVEVEVDLARGIPMFSMVGLPNAAVRESRERVTAAIKNSGFEFPLERITVNLAPADVRKEGAAFDLAIAVGIVVASLRKSLPEDDASFDLVDSVRFERVLFLGELALNGVVRPVRGVLPVLLHAREAGFTRAVIPRENFGEATVVDGVEVFGVETLGEALQVFGLCDEGEEAWLHKSSDEVKRFDADEASPDHDALDLSDVVGQETVKRALTIAAAGGHHMLLVGPPGAGKTMLARRLTTILPPLNERPAMETTMIYSIAGLLNGRGLLRRSPFRSPHHSASDAGLIGGGQSPRPGEVTLAHNGVLFLDELPEFKRHVLEMLREPLEEGRIVISRAKHAVTFPARFQLVAAMNPCPCGNSGNAKQICTCTPIQLERYRGRVSGPLMDRIALHVFVRPVDVEAYDKRSGDSSTKVLAQVVTARSRQHERNGDGLLNSRLPERLVRRYCKLDAKAGMLLVQAQKKLQVSARGRSHVLRVARTIADLEGAQRLGTEHIAEAIQYRTRSNRT